jgi:hypothetical protein
VFFVETRRRIIDWPKLLIAIRAVETLGLSGVEQAENRRSWHCPDTTNNSETLRQIILKATACLRNLAPNLGELKRRPEESCDRLKAKQSDIADKLKELCQSKAFLVPRRLKITRRVG